MQFAEYGIHAEDFQESLAVMEQIVYDYATIWGIEIVTEKYVQSLAFMEKILYWLLNVVRNPLNVDTVGEDRASSVAVMEQIVCDYERLWG